MMRACFFAVFGYLCGSVLFARLFSAAMGKDILCSSKDGNPGTSNAFQYGGFFCGLLTLLGDLCKGFLPVWLFLRTEEPPPLLPLVLTAPVLGHAFPVFYGFRGGKGIAVSFGCLLGLLPIWQPLAVFIGAFLFFSLVVRIKPHFQRTIAAYLAGLLLMALTHQAGAVMLGFSLITAVVLLRLHLSKEPREALQVQLL